jgi:hypothetical protein
MHNPYCDHTDFDSVNQPLDLCSTCNQGEYLPSKRYHYINFYSTNKYNNKAKFF